MASCRNSGDRRERPSTMGLRPWMLAVALVLWLGLWLLLAVAPARAQPPLPDRRIGEAVLLHQPGGGWDAPAMVPRGELDVTAGESVALPHARPRSVAEPGRSLTAQPQVVWYRLPVPDALEREHETALALYLPRWQTIGNIAVYVDGQRVHGTGTHGGSRVWNSFNRPLWVQLSAMAPDTPGTREVLLRMASQPGVGGALSAAWMGPVPELLPSYLLFFAASLAHGLRTVHFTLGDQPLLLPEAWFGWLTLNALGWFMVFIYLFILRIHSQHRPRLERGMAVLQSLTSVATLPLLWLLQVDAMLPLATAVALLMLAVAVVSGSRVAWSAGTLEGRLLAVWMLLFIPTGVHELLLQNYGRTWATFIWPPTPPSARWPPSWPSATASTSVPSTPWKWPTPSWSAACRSARPNWLPATSN